MKSRFRPHDKGSVDTNICRQPFDGNRGLQAALARLHHDDERVHGIGRGSTQMLDPGLHIDNHHLIAIDEHVT
jgi:hypothetical protein